jgi:dihydroorotase
MLKLVLPCTLRQRVIGSVIMGNLVYPNQTSTIEKAIAYKKEIVSALPPGSDYDPRMTLYLTDHISPEEVVRGFEEGVWFAVKLYMADQNGEGGTTGSQHGVRNLLGRYRVLEAMEKNRIPLLGHFEAVEEPVDEFDREIVSVDRDLMPILRTFPDLPVVVEHITDSRTAEIVASGYHKNLYATVTAHHLMINRNAMFRGGMNPDRYCKPVPKREEHRVKIRQIVTSGNKRFGAGTDSAPHDESAKARCCGCAAGIFTPYAVEHYAAVFDEDDALQHLCPFMSENFLDIYGVVPSQEMMTLERKPQEVPFKIGSVPVFRGGTVIPWTLVG